MAVHTVKELEPADLDPHALCPDQCIPGVRRTVESDVDLDILCIFRWILLLGNPSGEQSAPVAAQRRGRFCVKKRGRVRFVEIPVVSLELCFPRFTKGVVREEVGPAFVAHQTARVIRTTGCTVSI